MSEITQQKPEPVFHRYLGKPCSGCGQRFSMQVRYDKYTPPGSNTPIDQFSYLSVKCACEITIIYRDGRHSTVKADDYDKLKELSADLRQENPAINIKVREKKVVLT